MKKCFLLFAGALVMAPAGCAAEAPGPGPALTLEQSLAGSAPFRRLFLDAMVVEESRGLQRVFHAPRKHAANPVLPRTYEWEGWGPYLYGTVMWDGGKLRMWYNCLTDVEGSGLHTMACYAESPDGIKWERPRLGLVDWKGSKANNIVGDNTCSVSSVIKNLSPSPGREYAMYGFGRQSGPSVGFSSDGLKFNWDASPEKSQLFKSSDVTNFFYNPYTKLYTSTWKTASRRHRAAGIAVSQDGIKWRKPVETAVFVADDLDPDATQVYGMPVFPYQGMYIGLPWMYHSRYLKYGPYSANRMNEAQIGSDCTVDVQMAWSWDLINWTRPRDREPFIALGEKGSFDSGMIFTARAPVIVGDELYFYYGGFDQVHDDYKGIKAEIGLATMRLDGFCSMRAGAAEGSFISRREVFRTPRVTVNAVTQPGGYVTAELLDRDNNVLKGFAREDCVPFAGDSVRGQIAWKTKAFPGGMLEGDKKVRFFLKNADLYSYLPADINTELDKGAPDL